MTNKIKALFLSALIAAAPLKTFGEEVHRKINFWIGSDQRVWETEPVQQPGTEGIYEVTEYPYQEPTPEQIAAGDELIRRSFEAAKRNGWFDYNQGVADGYHFMEKDWLHYANERYLRDERVLDPERPEFLLYYDMPDGTKRLVGVMYLTRALREKGPQVAGPLTIWHYHIYPYDWFGDGGGLFGVVDDRSREMLHVWFIEHPEGPFATTMAIQPHLLRKEAPDRPFTTERAVIRNRELNRDAEERLKKEAEKEQTSK